MNLSKLIRVQWPFLCGVLALPVLAGFIFAATLVTPGYSHLTDTISHLGGREGPHPWVANTGFFLGGLLVLGFSYGFACQFGESAWGKLLTGLLLINGAAIIFAAAFETAYGAAPVDPTPLGSSVHEIAARISFIALTSAMVWGRPQWRGVLWLFYGLAVWAVVFGLLFLFEAFADYSGVAQRIFFALCGIWLEALALRLLWRVG